MSRVRSEDSPPPQQPVSLLTADAARIAVKSDDAGDDAERVSRDRGEGEEEIREGGDADADDCGDEARISPPREETANDDLEKREDDAEMVQEEKKQDLEAEKDDREEDADCNDDANNEENE